MAFYNTQVRYTTTTTSTTTSIKEIFLELLEMSLKTIITKYAKAVQHLSELTGGH